MWKNILPIVFIWTLHDGVRVFNGFEDITEDWESGAISRVQQENEIEHRKELQHFLEEQETNDDVQQRQNLPEPSDDGSGHAHSFDGAS